MLPQAFDYHGHSLAATDAHRLEANRPVIADESVEQRAENARAGHAEGMTQCDGSAVRVELVAQRIDAELARRRNHLRRKCLVDLDGIDVIDRHARALERLSR